MKALAWVTAAALLVHTVGCAASRGTLYLSSYGTDVGTYRVESRRTPGVTPETSEGSTARTVTFLAASVAVSIALSAVTYGAGYYVTVLYMPAWKRPHHLYPSSIVAKPLSWHGGRASGFAQDGGRTMVWAVGHGMSGVWIGEPPEGRSVAD